MNLSPYPSYKASGVEWLGDIPDHWTIEKVTHGFGKIGSGTTPKSDSGEYYDGEIPWVTTSELRETLICETKQSVTAAATRDYSALRTYPPGTLLFAMYGATIGRLGMLGIAATLNQACCAFAWPVLFDTRFVFYWLWMRRPILISLSSGGGQPNLSQDDLRQIRIPIPQLNEQRAIAGFLDRETAKLDTLVEKKRALIGKLKEKRAALISRTVTRGLPPDAARAAGLNPHPKLKPSGIEWLGGVPEHWIVTRLKNALKGGLVNGIFKTSEYFGSGARLINVFDAYRQNFLVDEDSLERVEATSLELNTYRVLHGDIFFVRSSLKVEGIGRSVCCLAPAEDVVFECHLVRARPQPERIAPTFLIAFLNSPFGTHWLISLANTVTMTTIGQAKIMDMPVLVPPMVEQRAIADYLDREIIKIDLMVEKVEAAIERLREYRSALITAAVTGKIDVRGAVVGCGENIPNTV